MPGPSSNSNVTVAVNVLDNAGLTHETCSIAVIPHLCHESNIARGLVVVAVGDNVGSAEALRWAFEEAVMRGGELEVIQTFNPDASTIEMTSQQRNLRELLTDWRSDFPGLAVRIDVTRGDLTQLLIEASAEAAVVVTKHPYTGGIPSSTFSVDPRLLAIGASPAVIVPAAIHANDRHRNMVPLEV